ncbi:Rad3-related DNA helicase [Pseudomonas duriflava]|uniref:Rad3-related DNA helicase n=1 Tax=Pseudomonas duriflava TaxID=459528 RepID=A0A562Q9H6_9PSED|nr:Rad3-related DNA helicase [Pseudomonas duriflava]
MHYVVAVRALCEFTAKRGDLDLRFTPSPTAQEGIVGHQVVTSRRGEDYHSEVSLSGEFKHLKIRGRADGYDPSLNQLEEIKTYRGDLARMPTNHRALHWAQVKMYGWLQCQRLGLKEIRLALVYFEITSQKETVLTETWTATSLKEHFEIQCSLFLDWADQELRHRAQRDRALDALSFPHTDFRLGQRPLAEAVYKAAYTECSILIQAPTGIGKTVGTLFPLLKAMPCRSLDKIFFLTAKTSGRHVALHALEALGASLTKAPLRIVELIAREKACEHLDKACHGESCPLANGFYNRLPAAREAALQQAMLSQKSVRDVALAHSICPYYLGHDLARWADVIVGDYNYFFDSNAMLLGMTSVYEWRVGVLVDEAHNLLERARSMYTVMLERSRLDNLRKSVPSVLKKPLDRVSRCWSGLLKEQEHIYTVRDELPGKLLMALQQSLSAINDHFNETLSDTQPDADLQAFYFDALQFTRLAETFGPHSLFELHRYERAGRMNSTLCIRNVIPAPFLKTRFQSAKTAIVFSATLNPPHFYRDTLGLPGNTPWVDIPAPFTSEQLSVRLVDHISTRYQDRVHSVQPISQLIGQHYLARPGNYLAFFSSFDYLQQVADAFVKDYPAIPCWIQSRRMDESARADFLARFTVDGCGIGFAVLGGSFGEGVDLPGSRLVGAFIATLGLPQLNPVNEQIKRRMTMTFGQGYDYTYLFPGLQKVIQAAGRVIRTPTDNGVVYLIDDRFGRADIQRLLPAWWRIEHYEHVKEKRLV